MITTQCAYSIMALNCFVLMKTNYFINHLKSPAGENNSFQSTLKLFTVFRFLMKDHWPDIKSLSHSFLTLSTPLIASVCLPLLSIVTLNLFTLIRLFFHFVYLFCATFSLKNCPFDNWKNKAKIILLLVRYSLNTNQEQLMQNVHGVKIIVLWCHGGNEDRNRCSFHHVHADHQFLPIYQLKFHILLCRGMEVHD